MKKKLFAAVLCMTFAFIVGSPQKEVHAATNKSVTVTDAPYRANGSDRNDDTKALQNALNEAKTLDGILTVRVPAGTYYINDALWIYSNTNFLLDAKATIVRTDDSKAMLGGANEDPKKGDYDALSNVTVSGGVWDGNVTRNARGMGTQLANLFYFSHGTNLTIKNLTLTDCCGWHHMELAGVQNCLIDNVTFKDYVRYDKLDYAAIDDVAAGGDQEDFELPENQEATYLSEALQIDSAIAENSAGAAPFDGTASRNITIQNCNFDNCLVGIGNHHAQTNMSNINILNNKFSNMDAFCMDLPNMQAVVKGNTASSVHSFINAGYNSNVTIEGNTVSYDAARKYGKMNMIMGVDSVMNIKNNKITGAGLNAIYASNSNLTLSNGNTISGSGRAAVRAVRGSSATVTGNTLQSTKGAGISADASKLTVSNNTLSGIGTEGIQAMNGSTGYISSNVINGAKGVGITVSGSAVNSEQNQISNTSIGIFVNACSNKIIIRNNKINNTAENGIYVVKSQANVTENAVSNPKANGIRLVEGSSGLVDKNTVTSSKASGISVDGGTANVTNNTVNTPEQDGVQLSNISSGTITGNKVSRSTGSGISIANSKGNIAVQNNGVTDSAFRGIFIYGTTGCNVSRNTVLNSGDHGIHLEGGNGNPCTATVENNTSVSSRNAGAKADIRVGYYCTGCVVRNNSIGTRGISVDAGSQCTLSNNQMLNGLAQDASGTWRYYENGVVNTKATGLCQYGGNWWYVQNGVVNLKATGLCQYGGSWWYVQNGMVNLKATGLCQYGGNWWYVQNGMVNLKATGLCQYGGSWWYVQNGAVNFKATGLCQYGGNWWYVQNGMVNLKATGLCQYGGSWWYVQNGMVNLKATGLCQYGGSWWYVQNGAVNFKATGLFPYGGSWWYVQNGAVNFGFSGYVRHTDGKTYRVVNGRVQ